MGAITKILAGVFGVNPGDLGKEILNTVSKYFPPNMSPIERANAELAVQQLLMTKERQANEASLAATEQFNSSIIAMEGTAAEIKAVPIIGPTLLMLRGAFRPIAAYLTVFMDIKVFSGAWILPADPNITTAFWVMTVLVLAFYFGERLLLNVLPIVAQVFLRK